MDGLRTNLHHFQEAKLKKSFMMPFYHTRITIHQHGCPGSVPGQKNTKPIIAFLDIHTCIESNYPTYNPLEWEDNMDMDHNRTPGTIQDRKIHVFSDQISLNTERAAQSPQLQANPLSRLIVLECHGYPRPVLVNNNKRLQILSQVVVAHLSIGTNQDVRKYIDIGLLPPAIKPISLSTHQRNNLCHDRKRLFAFRGRHIFHYRLGMDQLANQTANHSDFYIDMLPTPPLHAHFRRRRAYPPPRPYREEEYTDLIQTAYFFGAPRGDARFSYRFTEVLSAGTIPVLYSDEWLMPFSPLVVNWTEAVVFIPEIHMNRTREYLLKISPQQRCKMQQKALEIWDTYGSSRAKVLRGLIESTLFQMARKTL